MVYYKQGYYILAVVVYLHGFRFAILISPKVNLNFKTYPTLFLI